jgi:hypothetical protein
VNVNVFVGGGGGSKVKLSSDAMEGAKGSKACCHGGGPFQPFTIYLGEDQMLF